MSIDPKHSMPDLGPITVAEFEEHGHVGNVEEGQAFKRTDKAQKAVRVDEASATVTYVGEATPGSLGSAEVWRIKRITVSGTVTSIEWAAGAVLYDQVWDNRAALSYS